MRSTTRRPLADRLPRARRYLRRHRRSIAAGLAAGGVVLALASIRGATPDAPDLAAAAASGTGVRAGLVAVPIVLSPPAIAGTIGVGDVVDVVAITGQESATATVVAPRAAVLEVPGGGSAFTSSSTAVIVVAVREADALPLLAASASGALSILIR